MYLMSESVKGLLAELASAGRMEMTIDENGVHVTVDCGAPRKAKNATASRTAPKEPAKPRFGKKPGRKPKAEYKVVDGIRRRLYTFGGKTLTLREWAKKYGVGEKTMASRFRNSGTPETTRRRSKFDKTASLKAKLAESGGGK